jgi:hypothetical protein
MARRIVRKLLPDGSGRIRIHWVYLTPDGPNVAKGVAIDTSSNPIQGEKHYRIACMPGVLIDGAQKVGENLLVHERTDDPRASSCPECEETEEYKKAMAEIELDA